MKIKNAKDLNEFKVWNDIITPSILKFLEENFKFEEDFLSIGEHLLDRNIVVLNYNEKPVSIALIDNFSSNDDDLIAEEIRDRFYDKIDFLENSPDNLSDCEIKKNIEQLEHDARIFKKESFCYIFYCESNVKNKGYGSVLTSYLKNKYKNISALPMNDASLKMLLKNNFKSIGGFYYSINENKSREISYLSEINSPFK